ncbi:MAG: hypothetical protein U0R69_06815 [Gaiellales bacterium]
MDTFIGILELIAWGGAVMFLAGAVTYGVIKIFPTRDDKPEAEQAADSSG